jgi:4-carboxymuconolactone decarboxylase
MESERLERGRARLKEIGSSGKIEEMLEPIAPDMNRYIMEFAFGDIHARPGLGKKERELVILSALATLGHAPVELKSHVNLALNVGWTRQEVVEALMQLTVYAGFPTAINALFVAKEVFRERDEKGGKDATPDK